MMMCWWCWYCALCSALATSDSVGDGSAFELQGAWTCRVALCRYWRPYAVVSLCQAVAVLPDCLAAWRRILCRFTITFADTRLSAVDCYIPPHYNVLPSRPLAKFTILWQDIHIHILILQCRMLIYCMACCSKIWLRLTTPVVIPFCVSTLLVIAERSKVVIVKYYLFFVLFCVEYLQFGGLTVVCAQTNLKCGAAYYSFRIKFIGRKRENTKKREMAALSTADSKQILLFCFVVVI